MAQLERAVEIVDDDPTVISHLAEAYCAQKMFKKALPLYKKLQKIDPERSDISEKIRRCKLELGEK